MPPDWQLQSHGSLEKFRQQYLEGDSRAAARYFQEAKTSVAATGRPELAARVELYRCALGVAALDVQACMEYESLRADATADDQAYGDFLAGRPGAAARLPEQYRDVAAARDNTARVKALESIADPVSRLVAAGALFRATQLPPQGVAIAVDAASSQGYRSPLLAFLGVQLRQAEAAGDRAAIEAIRKRIDLVYKSLPGHAP